MAKQLLQTPAERKQYPCAVGVKMPHEKTMGYYHFRSKRSADGYAFLMDTSENEVKRYVILDDEAEGYPYREVSHFVL